MYVLVGIVAVLVLAFLIFGFYAASKENEVTARYEGVYGKLSARIAISFTFFGFVILVFSLLLVLIPGFKEGLGEDIMPTGVILAFGAVCLGVGLIAFKLAFKKCPEHLKSKLIVSMLITALGSSFKRTGNASIKMAKAVSVAAVLEAGFAPNYTLKSFDGSVQHFETVSVDGNYAKLYNNTTHELVEVWAHKDGYYVTDRFGNLYAPK